MSKTTLVSSPVIGRSIHWIRNERVMLDADLARIYGVTVKRLNEQVRRNSSRFPADFMFRLTKSEWEILRSQNATLRFAGHGTHRKYLPMVFTEHGAIMLANVLNSKVATQASIQVVRAFVRLRELATEHVDIVRKIDAMEKKYDRHFRVVFDAIRELMEPPATSKRRIGFNR